MLVPNPAAARQAQVFFFIPNRILWKVSYTRDDPSVSDEAAVLASAGPGDGLPPGAHAQMAVQSVGVGELRPACKCSCLHVASTRRADGARLHTLHVSTLARTQASASSTAPSFGATRTACSWASTWRQQPCRRASASRSYASQCMSPATGAASPCC